VPLLGLPEERLDPHLALAQGLPVGFGLAVGAHPFEELLVEAAPHHAPALAGRAFGLEGTRAATLGLRPVLGDLEQLTNSQQLTNSPDDVDYVGSSSSPDFHEGWGDIVAARYPAYGYEGNSDVFGMHIEHGVQVTVNLTNSNTLDDEPSWGTYPPSARQ
jgi:hypothetical protein